MRLDRWFRVHFPERRLRATCRSCCARARSGVNSKRVQANARLERRPAGARAGRRAPAAESERPRCTPPLGLSKGDRDFIEAHDPVRGRRTCVVLNKPYGIAVQGGTGTTPPHRRPARRHGRPLRRPAAAGASARPRHHRRAARRQASRCRGEARAHLPDALGRQDLLGAGQGRAEAAAGQGRGGAGQGGGPRRRPRAQGAARRAGQGHARHHALLGDRPRGAQGGVGVAEAGDGTPAPAARAHGADRQSHRRRQQVRGRQGAGRQRHRSQAASARAPPRHPASSGVAPSTSRRLCPSTCARRGSCWGSTRTGSTRTRRGRRTRRRSSTP